MTTTWPLPILARFPFADDNAEEEEEMILPTQLLMAKIGCPRQRMARAERRPSGPLHPLYTPNKRMNIREYIDIRVSH